MTHGELIETTPEHPFYTADGEWVEAEDLQPGDQIYALDNTYGTVESVVVVEDADQRMYNLTVDTAHTFFVGDGDWLVHNQGFCPADYYLSGLSMANQIAIVNTIRQYNPNMVIATRPRALRAAFLDGILRNKPEASKTIYSMSAGVRLVAVPQLTGLHGDELGTYRIMVAISDVDIGLVARRTRSGFENVSDDEFISMMYDPISKIRLPNPVGNLPGNMINSLNGADIVMHGSIVDGLSTGVISLADARFPPILNEEVWHLFGNSGVIDFGLGRILTAQYLPDVWERIKLP